MQAVLHILALFIALGLYGALLLKDDKLPEDHADNKRIEFWWHAAGAVVFVLLAYHFGEFFGWRYAPFCLACAWLLYAGIVHRIGLGKPFFFVGTTAVTDKAQQWIASKLRMNVRVFSCIVKSLALIISLYIIWR